MIYPRTDLFDLGGIRSIKFSAQSRQEISREASGRTQAKDMGTAIWRASFTTSPALFRDAQLFEAALLSLSGSIGSFLAHDIRRPYPAAHSDGAFADTARIMALDAGNAFLLRLDNLAPGVTLTPGDYLSFEYGARPSRALHVVTVINSGSLTADGSGRTGTFEVYPPLRPGAVVGASVTLKRAPCEMRLAPDQEPPNLVDLVASTVSFSCFQTF